MDIVKNKTEFLKPDQDLSLDTLAQKGACNTLFSFTVLFFKMFPYVGRVWCFLKIHTTYKTEQMNLFTLEKMQINSLETT